MKSLKSFNDALVSHSRWQVKRCSTPTPTPQQQQPQPQLTLCFSLLCGCCGSRNAALHSSEACKWQLGWETARGRGGGVQPCGETMRRLVSKRIERMFDGMLNWQMHAKGNSKAERRHSQGSGEREGTWKRGGDWEDARRGTYSGHLVAAALHLPHYS